MGVNILAKQVDEQRTYKIHFQNRLDELGSGYYLSGTPTATESTGGITISSTALEGVKQVKFTVTGGTASTTYSIAISVTATDGTASQTIEATVLLRVQDEPASTTVKYKPPSWKLEASHRFLKGIVKELVPIGDEEKGITQDDLNAAESFAWEVLISHLIMHYDITGWSNDPPQPLFYIWDLLASSYVAAVVGQQSNVDGGPGLTASNSFLSRAKDMIRSICDPQFEGLRIELINSNGTIAFKRSKAAIPKVVSTIGVVFFPADRDYTDAWGNTIEGSVEDFVDKYCIKTNNTSRIRQL